MENKEYYYSENEETEKEMIALFGIPDKEYDKAFEKCICTDNYETLSTEELFEIVKPLEEKEYWDEKLDGKNDREFLIGFMNWQKERAKDSGYYYDIREKHGIKEQNRQNTPYRDL